MHKGNDMKKSLFEGIVAGIYIGIGGIAFLSLENKIVGAVAFTIALLSICLTGAQLFTGKIGYMVYSHKKADVISILGCIIGNAIGTFTCALVAYVGKLPIRERAISLCAAKLEMSHLSAFFTAILCGVLMFTAVYAYKEKHTVAAIFFCVPVFILSGFEHSIADMFYFSATMQFNWRVLPFIIVVILGNTVGGMLMPVLFKLAGNKNP